MKLTAEQRDSRTRIVSVRKNLIQITVSEEAAKEMVEWIEEKTEDCDDSDPDALDGVSAVFEALEKGVRQLNNNRAKGSRANQ